MEMHLRITGILLIALSLLHIIFPRYFNWKSDLVNISLINRQLMYVHSFFIGLTVFLMGLFCLTSAHDLINTNLGKQICLGFGIFWIARLFFQFFIYSVTHWKGKKMETAVHCIFSVLWIYLSVIFFRIYLA